MAEIQIESKRRTEFIDITAEVNNSLRNFGIDEGIALIFTKHTTTALTINENESGIILDMESTLERIIPGLDYRHDRIDNNADSHLRAMLLGHNLVIPVKNSEPELGTWQRVFLVELDGSRTRKVIIRVLR